MNGSNLWKLCDELDFLIREPTTRGLKSSIFKLENTEYFVVINTDPVGLYWFTKLEDFDELGNLCVVTRKYIDFEDIFEGLDDKIREDIIFNMDVFTWSLPRKNDSHHYTPHNLNRAMRRFSESMGKLSDALDNLKRANDHLTVLPGGKSLKYNSSIQIKLGPKRKTLWEQFKDGVMLIKKKVVDFFAYIQESW